MNDLVNKDTRFFVGAAVAFMIFIMFVVGLSFEARVDRQNKFLECVKSAPGSQLCSLLLN